MQLWNFAGAGHWNRMNQLLNDTNAAQEELARGDKANSIADFQILSVYERAAGLIWLKRSGLLDNNGFITSNDENAGMSVMQLSEEYKALKAVARDNLGELSQLVTRMGALQKRENLDPIVNGFVERAKQPVDCGKRAEGKLEILSGIVSRELARHREKDAEPTMPPTLGWQLTPMLAEIFVDAQFAALSPEQQPSLLEHFDMRESLEENPAFQAARDYFSNKPEELQKLVEAAQQGLDPIDMSNRLQAVAEEGLRQAAIDEKKDPDLAPQGGSFVFEIQRRRMLTMQKEYFLYATGQELQAWPEGNKEKFMKAYARYCALSDLYIRFPGKAAFTDAEIDAVAQKHLDNPDFFKNCGVDLKTPLSARESMIHEGAYDFWSTLDMVNSSLELMEKSAKNANVAIPAALAALSAPLAVKFSGAVEKHSAYRAKQKDADSAALMKDPKFAAFQRVLEQSTKPAEEVRRFMRELMPLSGKAFEDKYDALMDEYMLRAPDPKLKPKQQEQMKSDLLKRIHQRAEAERKTQPKIVENREAQNRIIMGAPRPEVNPQPKNEIPKAGVPKAGVQPKNGVPRPVPQPPKGPQMLRPENVKLKPAIQNRVNEPKPLNVINEPKPKSGVFSLISRPNGSNAPSWVPREGMPLKPTVAVPDNVKYKENPPMQRYQMNVGKLEQLVEKCERKQISPDSPAFSEKFGKRMVRALAIQNLSRNPDFTGKRPEDKELLTKEIERLNGHKEIIILKDALKEPGAARAVLDGFKKLEGKPQELQEYISGAASNWKTAQEKLNEHFPGELPRYVPVPKLPKTEVKTNAYPRLTQKDLRVDSPATRFINQLMQLKQEQSNANSAGTDKDPGYQLNMAKGLKKLYAITRVMAESTDPKAAAPDLDQRVEQKVRELNESDAYSVLTDTYTKMTGAKNAENINRTIEVFEKAGSFTKLEKILQGNSESTFRSTEISALNAQVDGNEIRAAQKTEEERKYQILV